MTPLEKFQMDITSKFMYYEDDAVVQEVFEKLVNDEITSAGEKITNLTEFLNLKNLF